MNSGHGQLPRTLSKYKNLENLNILQSIKSEDFMLQSASKFDSKDGSSKVNSSTNTSSINRLMECQLCGNFSMDQEEVINRI